MIAAPQGVMDIEVTNSPELSVGEPQSVLSQISVVLVDIRLLAGVAKLVSVNVCEDSHGSPCVAVLFQPCREAPSGGTCWDTVPGRSY